MTVDAFKKKLMMIDKYYTNADESLKRKVHRKAELYELLLNLSSSKEETEQILDRYIASLSRLLVERR